MSPERMRSERGISLIEIVLALTILAIVLMALGGLMFQVGRYTRNSAAVSYRSAAAQMAGAWAQAIPWDSIPTSVGCFPDTTGQMTYTRCITVQTVTTNLKRVTTVITPTGK